MAEILTDADIATLTAEVKRLPGDYRARLQPRPKRGHREREFDVTGQNGSAFRVILRESLFNPLDFSVILAWLPPQSTTAFRLRRYNGKSHEHTNTLEGRTFYEFHVHMATERYQHSGLREDAFAEPTTRYQDSMGAVQCLIRECGFDLPPGSQVGLFDSEGSE
jgi:hypothetical protein